MKLADLFVSIQVSGLGVAKTQLTGLGNTFKGLGQSVKNSLGGGTGTANPIPQPIRDMAKELSRIKQPFTQLQRTLSKIGGEMGAGVQLATNMMRRAIAGQMQPVLAQLQRRMIDHIATTHNWGAAQKLGAKAILEIHTALGRYQEKVAAMSELLSPMTNTARKAFIGLTGAVTGFVTAGLVGTQEGNALALRFRYLSMQIAGIFEPVIIKVINLLERMTNWFRSLSGEQQQSILKWTAITAGVLGLAMVLPKLIAIGSLLAPIFGSTLAPILTISVAIAGLASAIGELTGAWGGLNFEQVKIVASLVAGITAFQAIVTIVPRVVSAVSAVIKAMRALTITEILMEAFSGPPGWAALAGGAAAAAAAIGTYAALSHATAGGDVSAPGIPGKKGRTDVTPTATGFESFENTWRRLQETSLQADFSKRTADATERIAENTDELVRRAEHRPQDHPAFGKV